MKEFTDEEQAKIINEATKALEELINGNRPSENKQTNTD